MCRNQQLASPQDRHFVRNLESSRVRRRLCGCVKAHPLSRFSLRLFQGPGRKPRRGFPFCGPSAKWSARHTPPWQASAVFTAAKNAENAEVLPRSTQSFVGARAARKAQRTTRRREDKTTGNPPLHPLGIRGAFSSSHRFVVSSAPSVAPSGRGLSGKARLGENATLFQRRGRRDWVGRALHNQLAHYPRNQT